MPDNIIAFLCFVVAIMAIFAGEFVLAIYLFALVGVAVDLKKKEKNNE